MKKFLYLSIFFFSFILLGVSRVFAYELDLANLGYASCLDDNDNIVFTCGLDSNGGTVFSVQDYSRVTNYFLVSDEFILSSDVDYSGNVLISFYDSDFTFISNLVVKPTVAGVTYSSVDGAFYARLRVLANNRVTYITDDLNSISSLNYAINSLTETVGNVFFDFTWVFLLAFSIVVIGFIIALILRVGK